MPKMCFHGDFHPCSAGTLDAVAQVGRFGRSLPLKNLISEKFKNAINFIATCALFMGILAIICSKKCRKSRFLTFCATFDTFCKHALLCKQLVSCAMDPKGAATVTGTWPGGVRKSGDLTVLD